MWKDVEGEPGAGLEKLVSIVRRIRLVFVAARLVVRRVSVRPASGPLFLVRLPAVVVARSVRFLILVVFFLLVFAVFVFLRFLLVVLLLVLAVAVGLA